MSGQALAIGPDPGGLTIRVIKSDTSWTGELVLYEVIDENLPTQHEQVIAWPAAPTLHFEDSVDPITSVLDEDPDTSTADAVARWTMDAEDIEDRREGEDVSLKVNGETWFEGSVKCRS